MQVIDWPADCFPIVSENWHLRGSSLSFGGVFGPGSVINVENRIWSVSVSLAALREGQWRKVRSVLDAARGQYGVIRIPVRAGAAQARGQYGRTFSGGLIFSNGTSFSGATLAGASVAQDAPVGATVLRLDVMPSLIHLAAMFSLPGDKVYRVEGFTANAVKISPPLRRLVLVGDRAEFVAPKVRM